MQGINMYKFNGEKKGLMIRKLMKEIDEHKLKKKK